jgi:hypothetical protein
MKQSKSMSMLETALSTAVGFMISLAVQVAVLPSLIGTSIPLHTNIVFAVIMTAVSLARGFVMRRIFEALHIRRPLSPFMQAVIAERHRQVEVEGWDLAHDDAHPVGEMAAAGAVYALGERTVDVEISGAPPSLVTVSAKRFWPWSLFWLKPANYRRDLVRGCALMIAEGEKFDRSRSARAA